VPGVGAIIEEESIIDESIAEASDICDDMVEESIMDEDMADVSAGADIMDESIIDDDIEVSIIEDEAVSCARAPVTRSAATAVLAKSSRVIVVSLGSTDLLDESRGALLCRSGAA